MRIPVTLFLLLTVFGALFTSPLRGSHLVPCLEQAIRDAHRLGVKFATGADNYYDEQSINRVSLEIMHLVRLGLSPFGLD